MRFLETIRSAAAATGIAAACLVGVAAPAVAAPVHAVTDANEIVEACGTQSVCLFDGATISNAPELASALPEGVRVIVIPEPNQAESVQSSVIATQVQAATGAETVIIIEDRAKDRFSVASDGDATAITEALYSQGESDGGIAVAAIGETLVPGSPAQAPGVGFDGTAVIFGAVALIAVAGATLGVILFARRRRNARGHTSRVRSARLEKELTAALNGEDGAYIQDSIEQLDRWSAPFPTIGPRVTGMTRHVSELFVRVHKRGSDQQLRLLQSKYKDTLSKLRKALNDDYYGDIVQNPQYWSNPEGRLAEVSLAIDSVDQQAVENIRQVNESRDLEFKVALDSLIQTVNQAKLSDVYTDREQ
ncbi:hypothetical protein MUN76_15075 [Leucobacter rhizosphaerae]|uniref:DUF5129 domain-containing protein n=1 Tax=Leucobacter rhizosphaerae TaxID=2932245 RepID=A0ABY4FVK2_9MICO|nr:hypothetical protein [Leucobacter rhizosphaerae]UOQ60334.1 hypothetical protein MUN76_15075 [Leucobacter rhizosphaerae]